MIGEEGMGWGGWGNGIVNGIIYLLANGLVVGDGIDKVTRVGEVVLVYG